MTQAKRLDRLQALVGELRQRQPARMIVALKDGQRVVTDPVGAIKLWQDGEVARVDTERDDYSELAGVISALCSSERLTKNNKSGDSRGKERMMSKHDLTGALYDIFVAVSPKELKKNGPYKKLLRRMAQDGEKAWSAVKGFFSEIWSGIKDAFANVGEWFSEKFKAAKNSVVNTWNNIGDWFGKRWTEIKNVFASVGNWFGDKFKEAKNSVTNAWSDIKSRFSNIWSNIKNAFNFKDALNWGRDLI